MVSDVSRFRNYEAKCARKASSMKETSSLSDGEMRPASEDGSEVFLDTELGRHPS